VLMHWSPDVLVLGGSMIVGDPSISLEMAAAYLKGVYTIGASTPPIKKAELDQVGGLYGALVLAQGL
ncbi:MAG: hypothetical protein Q7S15_02465, partial [bacterium]|nr:hypothetical protein [bacterium]